MEIFAQALGFVGAALLIASYQCRNSRNLFIVQGTSNFVYMIHFFLMGAYTGCFSLLVSFMRAVTLASKDKAWAQWRGWKWVYMVLPILVSALTWKDAYSALTCIAMLAMTWSMFSRNGRRIRIANFSINSPAWLIYDWHVRSYSGILCESLTILSVIISFIRYGWEGLNRE